MTLCHAVASMARLSVILVVIYAVLVAGVVEPGPQYPPTKGEVWPKAQHEAKEIAYYTFNPSQFNVKITQHNCTILVNAIERYTYVWKHMHGIAKKHRGSVRPLPGAPKETVPDANYLGSLKELEVELSEPCEQYPHYKMDERYILQVATTSSLKSESIWGVIRGLETLAQLFYLTDDFKDMRINKTHILDYPRHPHRGLLLDTSRHYIVLPQILANLDAMAINKMNVFHWHIVDDQSFPYQSEKFSELSEHGAYHPSMVYTKADIEEVVNYARDRGIRVIPEFDVPGHTRSWGVAYPHILTECYEAGRVIGLGPMNPTRNFTYKLLRDLFQEIQEWFPDQYLHVGGDEVELSCWASNPELRDYMKENNIFSVKDLHALFMRNVMPLLGNATKAIVWQEVYDEKVPLSNETLVQIWKGNWPINEILNVLLSGHQVLYSTSWYLDHLDKTFQDLYMTDPRQMVIDSTDNETLAENVVGGEACMWGEMIDDRNFMSRVWPRASAVAERLWSPGLGYTRSYWHRQRIPGEALHRIEEHTCRMIRRGISAQPAAGPGYCIF